MHAAYTLPGSYPPVTLTVGSAPCDLVLTEVIEVGISTGLEDLEGEAFSAWTEGDAIRLRWSFAGSGVHEVKLFDPRGREVKALRLSEAPGQATLSWAVTRTGCTCCACWEPIACARCACRWCATLGNTTITAHPIQWLWYMMPDAGFFLVE